MLHAARQLNAAPSIATARPVGPQIVGRPVEEATALIPTVVPLCALAQDIASRLALGVQIPIDVKARLNRDVILDHLMRLFIYLPHVLDLRAAALPTGWEYAPATLRRHVFGASGRLPMDLSEFKRWLAADDGVAPVIAAIGARFLPGEGAAAPLRSVNPRNVFTDGAVENSLAGRHANHSLLVDIAAKHGRGPLWRAAARLVDLDFCLDGQLPQFVRPQMGRALVHASRGVYAVEATTRFGKVDTFRRITPTDHLRASGGVWDQTLASLPADRYGEIDVIIAIMDPCKPLHMPLRD